MNLKNNSYINHINLVLDSSSSMYYLTEQVIQVADELIKYLAEKSTQQNQETRITVYTFASVPKCVVYEKDVLRLPSIREYYLPGGSTALIDAAMLSVADQRLHSQKYGDHAFLTYLITDGEENRSIGTPEELRRVLDTLADNETMAVLVPNESGKIKALHYGFAPGNVAIWEVSRDGVTKVGQVLRSATSNYMDNRATGMRKSTTMFSTGLDTVNKATVNSKTLISLKRDEYQLLKVAKNEDVLAVREWVLAQQLPFQIGKVFYELVKRESIQPQKALALQNIHSGRIYTGPQVRELLGLPDVEVRVSPDKNPEYRIFVQSTSVNRKLVPDTRVLLLK